MYARVAKHPKFIVLAMEFLFCSQGEVCSHVAAVLFKIEQHVIWNLISHLVLLQVADGTTGIKKMLYY